MSSLILTITKKDVETAIRRVKDRPDVVYCECPLAQAGKRVTKNRVGVNYTRVWVAKTTSTKPRHYAMNDMARTVVRLFDTNQIDRLKALLPVTLELKRI